MLCLSYIVVRVTDVAKASVRSGVRAHPAVREERAPREPAVIKIKLQLKCMSLQITEAL